MTLPFGPMQARGRVHLLLFAVATLSVFLVVRNRGHAPDGVDEGPVAGIFFGIVHEADVARSLTEVYGPTGPMLGGLWLGLDFVFALLVWGTIVPLATGLVAERVTSTRLRRLGQVVAWGSVIAFVADWVETGTTIELLVAAEPESLLTVIRTAAVVKISLGGLAILFSVAVSTALGVAAMRARVQARDSASLPGSPR
ncbi:MAG: hypothetical protein ACRCY8_10445 [Dermatophilaceae bacterium]